MKNSKGQELPQPYRDLAIMRREQEGGTGYEIVYIACIDWRSTPEGYYWWCAVDNDETPAIFDASLADLDAWRKEREGIPAMYKDESSPEPDYKALSEKLTEQFNELLAKQTEPDYKAMYEELKNDYDILNSQYQIATMSQKSELQSPTRNWIAECVPFQKCPVCDGYGEVRPIWNKDAQQPTYVKCSVCEGNKVILMYNAEAWAAEGKKRGHIV